MLKMFLKLFNISLYITNFLILIFYVLMMLMYVDDYFDPKGWGSSRPWYEKNIYTAVSFFLFLSVVTILLTYKGKKLTDKGLKAGYGLIILPILIFIWVGFFT